MKRIYLDYAASSPLAPGVQEAINAHLISQFANPNALYREGKHARAALEAARACIAAAIGAAPPELVFCSGGTEADNMAIMGIATAARRRKGAAANHIICSVFEHPAILEPIKALKSAGFDVTYLQPTRDGFITPAALKNAITNSTILVSIMAAQNEIGTIQPIAELAAMTHEYGALFHTDAVQALGKIPFDVHALGLDAASFSAHKIGGLKGTGALYLKQNTPFEPHIRGGGQEATRRSGTQDVAGAAGFANAVSYACENTRCKSEAARLTKLRDYLVSHLAALDTRIRLSVPIMPGDRAHHLPG
ncbi:MAG: aminotransferase class V-fold PLP-dependent enzyme, partial [Coriobacteriia bacterium]|nr:aminotransferase class V-fold PLP-dependent enzyme [Coriobacteriia bacterium]